MRDGCFATGWAGIKDAVMQKHNKAMPDEIKMAPRSVLINNE